jgi:hypothetical protein
MFSVMKCKQFVFALLLVGAVGCKKDDVLPQPPTPVTQEFVIDFSTETIPFQNVDSAVVIIRDADHFVKKSIRLQNRAASLYTGLTDLAAGVYTAEVKIQSKKEPDNTARQFALTKTFALPLQASLHLQAPTGSFTDTWFKRAVLFAPADEAIATIAMDPRDAFYEIQFKEAQWDYSMLQRYAVSGSVRVADGNHTKILQGIIGFADYAAFEAYTQRMQGKSWNKAAISLYIRHKTGREIYLDYEYNK